MECVGCRSATQAAGIDTILVDVWTSLIPPNGYTPDTVWATIAAPNPRVWEKTGAFSVPMNMTYVNATQSLVRPRCGAPDPCMLVHCFHGNTKTMRPALRYLCGHNRECHCCRDYTVRFAAA